MSDTNSTCYTAEFLHARMRATVKMTGSPKRTWEMECAFLLLFLASCAHLRLGMFAEGLPFART